MNRGNAVCSNLAGDVTAHVSVTDNEHRAVHILVAVGDIPAHQTNAGVIAEVCPRGKQDEVASIKIAFVLF